MSQITQFTYNEHRISFEFADGNKMINATEMAKPFGKLVGGFLRIASTKSFIELLESRYADLHIGLNKPQREVLRVIKGGEPELQGTWMDEKLALKFAAWLSPEFELWVYDRIEELLTKGHTSLSGIRPSGFAETLRLLAAQWEQQDQINFRVRKELDKTAERLLEVEAKIISSDENYYTIAGYCNLINMPCPLQQAQIWGKAATTMSKRKKVPTGLAHDERYGKVRTYHKDILKKVIR